MWPRCARDPGGTLAEFFALVSLKQTPLLLKLASML